MSGILGRLHHDGGSVSERSLWEMMHAIAFRGPDGCHVWHDGPIGLGHALLVTTPEAVYEKQPAVTTTPRLALAADARIDNRTELLRTLGLRSVDHDRLPDSALIVAGYERWGVDVVDHLVGDYAFALWDEANRHLFCARDPIGVRPFFYHSSSQAFVFASAPQAILADESIPSTADHRHILAYLTDREDDCTSTFYRAVHRLAPAHAMIVDEEGAVRQWRYWRPEEQLAELHLADDAAYEEGFRTVFEEAVQSACRTHGPLGIQLSGGLDSSAVAAVAGAQHRDGKGSGALHAFTAVFPETQRAQTTEIDEWAYAKDVIDHAGLRSHVVHADDLCPLDGLESTVTAYGQPFRPRSHYMLCHMVEEARANGIRVLLDGLEGDLVVGYGYDYFTLLARQGRWDAFTDVARQYAANCAAAGRHYPVESLFWDHGADSLLSALYKGRLIRFVNGLVAVWRGLAISPTHIAKRVIGDALRPLKQRVWRRDLKHRTAAETVVDRGDLVVNGLRDPEALEVEGSVLHQRARGLWDSPLLCETMEGVDALFAGRGMEARHPYFDRRVVEYCLSLPPEQRLKGGWTRSIVRRAMKDILPPSVRTRLGKSNLGGSLVRNLHQVEHSRLLGLPANERLSVFASTSQIERLVQQFVTAPTARAATTILRLLALSYWLGQKASYSEIENSLIRKQAPTAPEVPGLRVGRCSREHRLGLS